MRDKKKKRPLTVPKEQFESNWDAIFKKKEKPVPPPPVK